MLFLRASQYFTLIECRSCAAVFRSEPLNWFQGGKTQSVRISLFLTSNLHLQSSQVTDCILIHPNACLSINNAWSFVKITKVEKLSSEMNSLPLTYWLPALFEEFKIANDTFISCGHIDFILFSLHQFSRIVKQNLVGKNGPLFCDSQRRKMFAFSS